MDWLCVHQADPTPSERELKHAEQRLRILAWAEAHGLQLRLPDACLMPHPEHEATLTAPVSKINATGAPYALLDFSMSSPGLIKTSWLLWRPGHSDHAVLLNEVTTAHKPKRARTKSKWKPRTANETNAAIRACPLFATMSRQELCDRAKAVQDTVQDNSTRGQRSAARIPDEVRRLHAQIARAPAPEKKILRASSRRLLTAHRVAMRRHTITEHVKKRKNAREAKQAL